MVLKDKLTSHETNVYMRNRMGQKMGRDSFFPVFICRFFKKQEGIRGKDGMISTLPF